jgi:hypothetical protein
MMERLDNITIISPIFSFSGPNTLYRFFFNGQKSRRTNIVTEHLRHVSECIVGWNSSMLRKDCVTVGLEGPEKHSHIDMFSQKILGVSSMDAACQVFSFFYEGVHCM